MKFLSFLVNLSFFSCAFAQIPLNHRLSEYLVEWNQVDSNYSSFRDPFAVFSGDSIYQSFNHDSVGYETPNWLYARLYKDSWFKHKGKNGDYFSIDPYVDMRFGPEFGAYSYESIWRFKRGAMVQWQLNDKIKVFSLVSVHDEEPDYFENVRSRETKVLSGVGELKFVENRNRLYSAIQSMGAIEYQPFKQIKFTAGHGKNFIGDGYRSLILSDLATSYPYLKMNFNYWKFNYNAIVAEFIDLPSDVPGDGIRQKKYGSFHFLDVNLTKNINFAFFEGVIWSGDSLSRSSFDVNYLNPFAIMRPLEFNLGSPDNMLLGFNASWKFKNAYKLYYQFVLDELVSKELIAGNGWWANKYALQLGARVQNPKWFPNFTARYEFNWARPFMYTHRTSVESYAHMNQALAHPLGANFYEALLQTAYKYKRWLVQFQTSYYQIGNELTDSTSIGQDIQRSYYLRESEYDNKVLQGNLSTQWLNQFKLSWCVNPANFMFAEIGIYQRNIWQQGEFFQQHHIFAGIRTSFLNHYYDY
jgi:hypothetical protein